MGKIEKMNERWRTNILSTFLKVSIIIFLTEFVIFFFDDRADLLFLPIPLFLFRFLIFPTILNFTAVYLGVKTNHSDTLSDFTKNVIVCVVAFIICACVECTHYVFAPVLCAPICAIFITSIFGKIQITRIVTILSMFSLGIAGYLSSIELRAGDKQLPLDIAIALIMTICTYLIVSLTIRHEKERNAYLTNGSRKQLELKEQLNRDFLTGLNNRKVMFDTIEYSIKKKQSIYLAVIDIDDFKQINDIYGHAMGDEVLKYLAQVMKQNAIPYGCPTRFGGEEFGIVFVGTDEITVLAITEQIRKEFASHPFQFLEGYQYFVTLSCGIAKYEYHQSPIAFFEAADRAMYAAKSAGKNVVVSHIKNSRLKHLT